MRPLKIAVLAGLLIGAFATPATAMAQAPKADMSAGHKTIRLTDPRQRQVQIDLWYPTQAAEQKHDYRFGAGSVAEDAAFADGRFPIVLLSHGAMGAATNYSWIAEPLARHGYMVAGVSHYGESPVFGPDTINPAAASHFSDRTGDFLSALDLLVLTGSPIQAHIDPAHIGAIGHSSGGATALMLAGAPFAPADVAAYCAKAKAADKGCLYPRDAGSGGPIHAVKGLSIDALVLMDPAVGPGFTEAGLKALKTPALVIGSTNNDFLPYAENAGRIAQLLPSAEKPELTNGEGHFVYLDTCTLPIDVMGVKLCSDRPGVNRTAVHAKLVPAILSFFDKQLPTKQ